MTTAIGSGRFRPTDRYPSLAAVAAESGVDPGEVLLVGLDDPPVSNAELPALPDRLLAWRRTLGHVRRLHWVHPLGHPWVAPLTVEELEQLAGLLASDVEVTEDRAATGEPCLVASGRVRQSAVTVAWRWSTETLNSGWQWPLILAGFGLLPAPLKRGLHLIQLPIKESNRGRWSIRIDLLTSLLHANAGGASLGLIVSRTMPLPVLQEAYSFFRRAAPRAGTAVPIRCLLVEDFTDVRQSEIVGRLAEDWELGFDCSLEDGEPAGEAVRAYVPETAYVPLTFDLRLPSFVAKKGIVEVPRTSSTRLIQQVQPGWMTDENVMTALGSQVAERRGQLLELALDHEARAAFHARLETDASLVGEWHRFHVYNLAPPAPRPFRLIEFDARTLASAGTDVRRLRATLATLPGLVTAEEFLTDAEATARAQTSASLAALRATQTQAHRYLAEGGRPEMTADSARILDILPPRLGTALEIGSGYGLLARRVRARADRYVGLELETDQARALAEFGAVGLVGDLHMLPFGREVFDTVVADNVLEHAGQPARVFAEIRRVLRPRGGLYALIPLDALSFDYQIRTHLWKADETSIREVARSTGFEIRSLQVLSYSELGVHGAFPASRGKTCLVHFTS